LVIEISIGERKLSAFRDIIKTAPFLAADEGARTGA
jgi:hypothetical protein